MSQTISQPRLLLRRLHGVMASAAPAQERLDRVVRVVAQNMVAEVCSIYLTRAGGVMELFATEGLKREAVHATRMTTGEGLVGLVAERSLPLSLSEAPSHPRFSYRPETGEDLYHSFLGVPIVKGNQAVGVLVVQNVAPRRYTPEEVEVLQTIAMVISELVASEELVSREELYEDVTTTGQPITLEGQGFSRGLGLGQARFLSPAARVRTTVAQDSDAELALLEDGLSKLRIQFDTLLTEPDPTVSGAYRDVIETFRMFAVDQGWRNRIREAIESGLTAEAAAARVQQSNRARMREIRDPYLRERMHDFDDVTNRLIRILQGDDQHSDTLDGPTILVARNLGAAELMTFDRRFLKAVLIEEGTRTSHMTIIARALGIPVIGRVPGLLDHVEEGEDIIVDAMQGKAFLRPAEDVLETYRQSVAIREEELATYASERDLPAKTLDGTDITLMMNAGLLVDLPNLSQTGAAGIGLFRTEFQFLVSETLPKVSEQEKIYAAALDSAGPDRPVVFRTLDIGGDKQVPFLPREQEENPAMGWRAIRIGLDRPALLRFQLRALLYAAEDRDLSVMFPMIAEIAELKRCKRLLDKELKRLSDHGRKPPRSIRIGCMIEVPSLVFQLDGLVGEVDFLSLGTNDLMQFFFACDRGNPALSGRYDLLAPSAMRFLKMIVDKVTAAGVPLTVCGEMGGNPMEALALMSMGFTKFSVSPTAVGPMRRLIRQVNLPQLRQFFDHAMTSDPHSIRDSLTNFARDHRIKF